MRPLPWLCLLALACVHPDARHLQPSRYADVVRLIERSPATGAPVRSVDELVTLLPDDLRANFTFVHHSDSPHGPRGDGRPPEITPEDPRVILFSADARVVLALGGDPTRAGHDTVEIIHFDDPSSAFVLSRFILPATVEREPALGTEAAHNGQPNPPACLRCHGADPRPILESYPLWPGFYGSVSDSFTEGTRELGDYRAFLTKHRSEPTGLYQHLQWPPGSSVSPYVDPASHDPRQTEVAAESLRLAPNTRLGMALTELNRRRIHRKLAAAPSYPRQKYGILAELLGCNAGQDTKMASAEADAAWSSLVVEAAERKRRLDPRNARPVRMQELAFHEAIAQLRRLATTLDVSPADWSMSTGQESLALYDGVLSGIHEGRSYYLKEDFILEMLRALAATDPAFADYFSTKRVFAQLDYPFGERLDIGRALAACPALLERAGGDSLASVH